jgi:hypothetical protein
VTGPCLVCGAPDQRGLQCDACRDARSGGVKVRGKPRPAKRVRPMVQVEGRRDGDVVTVVLPLPDRATHQNASSPGAFREKADAIRERRALACRTAQQCGWKPRWARAVCEARFYFAVRRKRDTPQLVAWLKASVDGLQDAGLVVDDNGISIPEPVVEIDPDRPRLVLTLREARD